jgi:hypothetical protein
MNSIVFLKAAYIIAWVAYGGYLASIWLRFRHVREEMRDLKRQ